MTTTGSDKKKHSQLTMWDLLPEQTAEREGTAGVCESRRMVQTDTTNDVKHEDGMLEKILTWENLTRALKRVKANKGAPDANPEGKRQSQSTVGIPTVIDRASGAWTGGITVIAN